MGLTKQSFSDLRRRQQGTMSWFNAKRFRFSAGHAARCAKPSTDVTKAVDSDANYYDVGVNFNFETAIKLIFHRQIFETGLWVDEKNPWLCASPDGIFLHTGLPIPVEMKVICANKTEHQLILEYYAQLQLQMHVCKAVKALLVIYARPNSDFSSFLVELDQNYLDTILAKLEQRFYGEVVLCQAGPEYTEACQRVFSSRCFEERYLSFAKKVNDIDLGPMGKLKKKPVYSRVNLKPDVDNFDFPPKLNQLLELKNSKQQEFTEGEFGEIVCSGRVEVAKYKRKSVQACIDELLETMRGYCLKE